MTRVAAVLAIAGSGLAGDRYALQTGHFSGRCDCQVTMIEAEVLDQISAEKKVQAQSGEHRRNIVTRGLVVRELHGRRLRIGGALLEFDRPRPPCSYVERLTEPGMTKALGKGAGIGLRVIESGLIVEGAEIEVIAMPGAKPRRVLP